MFRTQLRKMPELVVTGRDYDWTEVNRMLSGDYDSVVYVCRDSEEAKKAYLTLRSNKASRDHIIVPSLNGNEVTVCPGI